MVKKQAKKFFFSVEGETEMWYLQWLSQQINTLGDAGFRASFDIKIEKNPLSRIKGLQVLSKSDVFHVIDRESEDSVHVQQFATTLKQMRDAQRISKAVSYKLGYSNFTFDLWMILHKINCNASFNYRHQYLNPINSAFQERFSNMNDYKKEVNFKRLLNKLSLADVWAAVDRSDDIMIKNKKAGYIEQQYCGYRYYTINPSLSVGDMVKKTLSQCMVPREFTRQQS